MSPLSIQVLESVEQMERLAPSWRDLWRSCPGATPFQSPEWLIPWTRHLFGGGDILVLTVNQSEQLIGLAPLFRWGTNQRVISFLGAGISDYGDFLFSPGREAECVCAVRDFLLRDQSLWSVLDLREIRSQSALLHEWPSDALVEECSVCPVLDLHTYPASMDPKHRTDVRRAGNKLRKEPGVSFSIAEKRLLSEHMSAFLGLYETRWGPMDAALRDFHYAACAAFAASGLLRLGLLRIGDVPAAAIYAFVTPSTLCCYLSAFDPAQANLSPGAVLLGWMIEQAVAEGKEQVDFLRDNEPYKYLWGARDRINYRLQVSRS